MKISQKALNYEITNIDGDSPLDSKCNLFRDYSATNRKGLTMTTRKGVPLMARIQVTATAGTIDMSGSGGSTADVALSATGDGSTEFDTHDGTAPTAGEPFVTTTTSMKDNVLQMRFYGCSNGWVTRNAAVKTHAAREKMFKDAGVKKATRGSYDHTIRYVYSSGAESYLTPQTLEGNIVGGTWDPSQLIFQDDVSGAHLSITGQHASEESTLAFTTLNIQQMYMASRVAEVPADSNLESEAIPKQHSVLNKIFQDKQASGNDEIVVLARGEQDNPPYDLADIANDYSEQYELGRLQFSANIGHAASTVIEVPFGIFKIRSQVLNASEHSTGDVSCAVDVGVKLLGVYPMEG